jgi:hypothetical protein
MSRDVHFSGCDESRFGGFRFRDLSDDVDLRRVHHAKQHSTGGDIGAGGSVAPGNDPVHGGADNEQSFSVRSAACACGGVVCQARLGGVQSGFGLFFRRPGFVQALLRCRAGGRKTFRALAIAYGQRKRGLCLCPRPLQLW